LIQTGACLMPGVKRATLFTCNSKPFEPHALLRPYCMHPQHPPCQSTPQAIRCQCCQAIILSPAHSNGLVVAATTLQTYVPDLPAL
jgi:hypothetical protein